MSVLDEAILTSPEAVNFSFADLVPVHLLADFGRERSEGLIFSHSFVQSWSRRSQRGFGGYCQGPRETGTMSITRSSSVASSLSPASSPPRYPLIRYVLSKAHNFVANRLWMYASAPSATSGVSTLLRMLLLSISLPYRQQ